jgi:hypothetical protein
MAEPKDPLDAFLEDETVETGTPGFNVEPLTPTKRLILQNFFDTNTEARKKLLKQMGYEMNPSDDNQVRPIGSKQMYIEIDPGFSDAYKKGGLMGVGKEILQDVGDIGYDMADFGQKVVAILGGAVAGSVPGALAAGAASGALSNTAKQNIRDLFLDEDMPFDAKEMAVDSALSAVGAGAGKFLKAGARKLKDFTLSTRIDGIKNAIKSAGNVADPELIEKAARNPEMFTKEAVEGGNRRLYEATKGIFGLEGDEILRDVSELKRIRSESYFGKMIDPLRKAQTDAVNALSLDRNANVPYADASEQLQKLYTALEEDMLFGNPTSESEEAFEIVKNQIKNLKKMAAGNLGVDPEKITDKQLSQASFNFGQARRFLDGFQDKAFNVTTNRENATVRKAAGGMRQYLDDVAVKSGNEIGKLYPETNAQMFQILEDYNRAKQLMGDPGKIMRAYVGGAENKSAFEIKDFMTQLDEKYKTNLAKDFEPAAAQAVFENVYRGTPAKGSSRVNAFMVGETVKGAGKGLGIGAGLGSMIPGIGTGTGATIGLVGGGIMGASKAAALANPETGLKTLGGMLETQAKRNAMDPTKLAIQDALAAGVGAGALSQAGQVQGTPPEEIDPLDAYLAE